MAKPQTCEVCNKSFTKSKSLYRHLRKIHKIEPSVGKLRCPVKDCNVTAGNRCQLRRHLLADHNIEGVEEDKTFNSEQEFRQWMREEEKRTMGVFVLQTAKKEMKTKKGFKSYYYCHRAGTAVKRGKGQRRSKSQGTCKISRTCPACIEVEHLSGGNVHIHYYKTHAGHSTEVAHLRLSTTERAEIAGKLAQGITIEKILDDIRNGLSGNIERIHLITRKDVSNIARDFNIHRQRAHDHVDNDADLVALWVEEMKSLDNECPVLYYKQQGCADDNHIFSSEDIMLVIMTVAQQNLLKKFGADRICMDSVHDDSGYDFLLSTLLVVNEFGSVFPAAFCISNKTEQSAMGVFLSAIKEKVGIISAKTFMTDDVPAFLDAWVEVMGAPTAHLLCSWHVDRIWRKQILQTVKSGKETQAWVYKTIRSLMVESDAEVLKTLISSAVSALCIDGGCREFGKYFERNYASRVEVWAHAYRSEAIIGTNTQLEEMHRILKHIYIQHKKVKRVDQLLHALMRMTRDNVIERIRKLCWNEASASVKAIRERHDKSLKIVDNVTWNEQEESWSIKSHTNKSFHTVARSMKDCPGNCKLICEKCSICVHKYTCTCADFLVRCGICKHIHAVSLYNGLEGGQNMVTEMQDVVTEKQAVVTDKQDVNDEEVEWMATSLNANIPTPTTDNDTHRELLMSVESKVYVIMGLLKRSNISYENVKMVAEHFDKVIDVLTSKNKTKSLSKSTAGAAAEPPAVSKK